jgi:hypothetical protein
MLACLVGRTLAQLLEIHLEEYGARPASPHHIVRVLEDFGGSWLLRSILVTLPEVLPQAHSNQTMKLENSSSGPRVRKSASTLQGEDMASTTFYGCCSAVEKSLSKVVKVEILKSQSGIF